MNKEYQKLSLDKVTTAGWFQWYNLKQKIQYPECHVLTYQIDNSAFVSEVLDFNFFSMGNSISDSFDSLSRLCLEYLNKYKNSKMELQYHSSGAEKWNKFREIYSKLKMSSFRNDSAAAREKHLLFLLYDENIKLTKQISSLKNSLNKTIQDNIEKDDKIAMLRGIIDEISVERFREKIYPDGDSSKGVVALRELVLPSKLKYVS